MRTANWFWTIGVLTTKARFQRPKEPSVPSTVLSNFVDGIVGLHEHGAGQRVARLQRRLRSAQDLDLLHVPQRPRTAAGRFGILRGAVDHHRYQGGGRRALVLRQAFRVEATDDEAAVAPAALDFRQLHHRLLPAGTGLLGQTWPCGRERPSHGKSHDLQRPGTHELSPNSNTSGAPSWRQYVEFLTILKN